MEISTEYKTLKPAGSTAVCLVLFAEVAPKSLFLAKNLCHHDREEKHQYTQCHRLPQPYNSTDEVSKCSCEHGVAVKAVGTVGHQMLRAWCHFMTEGVHRVALAALSHMGDGPDAK